MSRILARGLALASWGYLTINALGMAIFMLDSPGIGAVIVGFGLSLDVIGHHSYKQTLIAMAVRRRRANQSAGRTTEIAVSFYLIALFFLLAFVQGSDGPIFGLDPRIGACLALMGGLFAGRQFFAMKRARVVDPRAAVDDIQPLAEFLLETNWGFLVLLVFPLFVLPARVQRVAFNMLGYGLGLALAQAAFLLILKGEPGLATVGLLALYPAALFFCAFLLPVFARSPLLAEA